MVDQTAQWDAQWNQLHPGQGPRPEGYHGEGGGGGGGDVNSILQNSINSILGFIKPPPTPFEEANPFFFDEQLAQQASTAEYSPYYDEKLKDYISQTETTKGRSQQDLQNTLDFLSTSKDYYTGVQRRALDKAIRNTNEGYAGNGLFFSGVRGRDIQELQTENQAQVGDYMSGYNYKTNQANLANTRTTEDANLNQSMYTRDIGREKQTAIAGGVLQRKGEARDEYEMARQKYYQDYNSGLGAYG